MSIWDQVLFCQSELFPQHDLLPIVVQHFMSVKLLNYILLLSKRRVVASLAFVLQVDRVYEDDGFSTLGSLGSMVH